MGRDSTDAAWTWMSLLYPVRGARQTYLPDRHGSLKDNRQAGSRHVLDMSGETAMLSLSFAHSRETTICPWSRGEKVSFSRVPGGGGGGSSGDRTVRVYPAAGAVGV